MIGAVKDPFRAQLMLPGQREIYDYWLSKTGPAQMPSRNDIKPSEVVRLLPNVSLIDVHENPSRFSVRLAGTQLREIFGHEITGLFVDEIVCDTNKDYWHNTCLNIVETGIPDQGVIRGPQHDKDHLVQFWLRLPLSTGGNKTGMILGYDAWVPAIDLPSEDGDLSGRIDSLVG